MRRDATSEGDDGEGWGRFVIRHTSEAVLAVVGVAAIRQLWVFRTDAPRDLPVVAAAVLGAAGAAVGGTTGTRVWAAAALMYVLFVVMWISVEKRPQSHLRPTSAPLVLYCAIVIWLAIVDFAVGLNPMGHLASYVVVGLAIAASAAVVNQGGIPAASAARAGLAVVALSDIAALMTHSAWRDCDQFKCDALGGLYRGPYESENFLALMATMTLAWTLTALSGRQRTVGAALCILTVAATGSRTGLIVSGLTIVAFVALSRGSWRRAVVSWLPASAIALTAAAIGLYMTFHASASALSNRGDVWRQALVVLQGHHLFGRGLSTYAVYQEDGLVSQHFTHSEYLFFLFAGGYVAVGLFVAWVAVTIRGLGRVSAVGAIPVIAVAAYGLTEATWNPLAFDAFAWIAVALCVTVPARALSHASLKQNAALHEPSRLPLKPSLGGASEG
jgi:hypothetical protein